MLPGVSVFNSQRPSFDSASCNISPSEWHVGCDIDHVIMDFDMKKINLNGWVENSFWAKVGILELHGFSCFQDLHTCFLHIRSLPLSFFS